MEYTPEYYARIAKAILRAHFPGSPDDADASSYIEAAITAAAAVNECQAIADEVAHGHGPPNGQGPPLAQAFIEEPTPEPAPEEEPPEPPEPPEPAPVPHKKKRSW